MKPIQRDIEILKQAMGLEGRARTVALREYTRPTPKSDLDRASVLFDWALAAGIFVHCAIGFYLQPIQLLEAALAVPFSLFLADLVGQFFHKWLDSYASEANPLWGKAAQEFRKHHEFAGNLNGVPYLSHVAAFGKLMAPFFIAACFGDWTKQPALGVNLLLILVFLLNTTEIHKQAHTRHPHALARFLQKIGVAISFDRHLRHHVPPYGSDYAVLNGWSQPILDKTGFWRWADRAWWNVFAELPRTWIQDPRAIPDDILQQLSLHPEDLCEDLVAYSDLHPERISPKLARLLTRAKVAREA